MMKCQHMLHSGVDDHKMSKCLEMLHPLIPSTDCCIGTGHDMLDLRLSTECCVGSFVFGSSKGQNAALFLSWTEMSASKIADSGAPPPPSPPLLLLSAELPRGPPPALVKRRGGEGGEGVI